MGEWEDFRDELLNERPEARCEYERLGPTYQIIADVLRLQHLRGLSYEELAAKMGKKPSVIARLELGNANPSLAFLQELAEALDAKLTIRLEPKGPIADNLGQTPASKRAKRSS